MASVALPALAVAGLTVVSSGVAAAATHTGSVAPYGNAAPANARVVVVDAQLASPAKQAELDATILNDSHGCSGSEVSNNSYVHVCYVRYGDVLWVRDDEANGRTAMGQIEGYDSASGGDIIGVCRDPYTYASGKWMSCGFGLIDEHTTVYYFGFDRKSGTADAHATAVQSEPST